MTTPMEAKKSAPVDFEFIALVGQGSVGKVFQAKKKEDGKVYAVKVMKKKDLKSKKAASLVMGERNILLNQHPFLIRMYESFQTNTKLYFVLDFINGGELFHHLEKEGNFSEPRAKYYTAELTSALGFLHEHSIVYRDMKLENILIDSEGHIKLTDFGLSRQGVTLDTKAFSFCGTKSYVAPEQIKKLGYNKEVDWWCLGTVLHEMLFGYPPFYHDNQEIMFELILTKPLRLRNMDAVTDRCFHFLNAILAKTPQARLGHGVGGTESVKTHEFFSDIDFQLLDQKAIEPPWIPGVSDDMDTKHFDDEFLDTNVNSSVATSVKTKKKPDKRFVGFSYARPMDVTVTDALNET